MLGFFKLYLIIKSTSINLFPKWRGFRQGIDKKRYKMKKYISIYFNKGRPANARVKE